MTIPQADRLFKILSADDATRADALGHTDTALDRADGYVHLSTRAQVAETLNLHYRHADKVQLFEIPIESLQETLKWEPSRGGDLFPHLYDQPLRLDVATRRWTLSLDGDGYPVLPSDFGT